MRSTSTATEPLSAPAPIVSSARSASGGSSSERNGCIPGLSGGGPESRPGPNRRPGFVDGQQTTCQRRPRTARPHWDSSNGKEPGTGGNAWTQTGPYQPDPAAAFRQTQQESLAQDDHGFERRSVEQLWRDPAWHEYIFTGGTSTVLDFPATTDTADRSDGPFMRPLTEGQMGWIPYALERVDDVWGTGLGAG